jgi:hypothetical protein
MTQKDDQTTPVLLSSEPFWSFKPDNGQMRSSPSRPVER